MTYKLGCNNSNNSNNSLINVVNYGPVQMMESMHMQTITDSVKVPIQDVNDDNCQYIAVFILNIPGHKLT